MAKKFVRFLTLSALIIAMLTLALTAFPNDVAPSYDGVPSAASVNLLYHKFVKPILAIF